jgi:hypothetical protein
MLHKARATLAGTAGSYLFGCAVDHTCMARLRIAPELVLDLAARHTDEHAVLDALRAPGIPSPAEAWFDGQVVEDELQNTPRAVGGRRRVATRHGCDTYKDRLGPGTRHVPSRGSALPTMWPGTRHDASPMCAMDSAPAGPGLAPHRPGPAPLYARSLTERRAACARRRDRAARPPLRGTSTPADVRDHGGRPPCAETVARRRGSSLTTRSAPSSPAFVQAPASSAGHGTRARPRSIVEGERARPQARRSRVIPRAAPGRRLPLKIE